MRNIYLLFILLFTFTNSLYPQSLSNTKVQLVLKRTADWCSKCGSYGWDIFKGLEQSYKDQPVLVLAVHTSGNLRTPTSLAITENYAGFGQPIFYVNGIEVFFPSNNAQDGIDSIKNFVSKVSLNKSSLFSFGIAVTKTGESTYKLTTNLKPNEAIINGQYYAAHYLVDDHKIAYQENQGLEAIHTGYLERSLTDSPFGDLIIDGRSEKDKLISRSIDGINLTINQDQLRNFRIVTVVWKANIRGKFDYIDARVTSLADVKVGVAEEGGSKHLDITAYQSEDHIILELQDPNTQVSGIQLIDANGKLLNSSFSFISEGSVKVELGSHSSGIHFLRVVNFNGQKTIPIYLSSN